MNRSEINADHSDNALFLINFFMERYEDEKASKPIGTWVICDF